MSELDVVSDVFRPVAKRIIARKDSLRHVARFPRSGIEGWLKVEAIAALKDKVERLQNKGPDLRLGGGLEIELKAATDLNPSWIETGVKYGTPCLFLGSGQPVSIGQLLENCRVRIVAQETFDDGQNRWVIGMAMPQSM